MGKEDNFNNFKFNNQEYFYSKNKIKEIFDLQKSTFLLNCFPEISQRISWLKDLKKLILENKNDIIESIYLDFGNRSKYETLFAEILPSINSINNALNNLKEWMMSNKRKVGLIFYPSKAKVEFQPLGVVGIIVPWNYPLFLSISALVGALSAGNRVMIKISESSVNFGILFSRLINKYFPIDLVSVALGKVDISIYFSKLPFDHLLFTGSTNNGKKVMHLAASNLTPVTLELGGKSPAIISNKANFKQSIKRIAFGKAINSGQTCVSPDYVFVPVENLDKFVFHYTKEINKFFKKAHHNNDDCTSIINDSQYDRLKLLVKDAEDKGAKVKKLLSQNSIKRKFPHYLIFNVNDKMKISSEEIFGPILLVYTYENLFEVVNFINDRPRPLALYFFSKDKQEQRYIISHTRSGGVCINDTMSHVGIDNLPFGGIGESGIGQYHGKDGFLTFSKARAIFTKSNFDALKLFYPPYGRFFHKLVYKFFMR